MAVIFQQELPAFVPMGMIDAVTDEMGTEVDPPEGLIVHTHSERDGRVQILDVWESVGHHDRFVSSRLLPAMQKVAQASGFELPSTQPEETVTEVHRLILGR